VGAAPSPVPDPAARLVLASWPAFTRALASLSPLPADGPVDLDALDVGEAERKQVVATLRTLGLVDEHDAPHFRLRRLVSKADYTLVVDTLADRFPELAAAIATGDPDAIRSAVDSFDAPASSKARFWRFVRAAHAAAGDDSLPALVFTAPARPEQRAAAGPAPPDDPVARQSAEAELAAYQDALVRLLSSGDLDGAGVVSARLRELRDELRRHRRPPG
jgi:hypothetical protein